MLFRQTICAVVVSNVCRDIIGNITASRLNRVLELFTNPASTGMSEKESSDTLSVDIANIEKWLCGNKLRLNIKK